MRRLRAALAACALAAVPVALLAQQTQQTPTSNVRPNPPVHMNPTRPRPVPSGGYGHNNHRYNGYGRTANPYANSYPIVIDGNAINRLLATPAPKPKRTPAARLPNGEQVFETHSTNDAR